MSYERTIELNEYQVRLILSYLNQCTDYNEHRFVLVKHLEDWLEQDDDE